MTPKQKQKRRAREALRRKAQRDEAHRMDVTLATSRGEQKGYEAGHQEGGRAEREKVLHAAGQLYKEHKDADAAAVRKVYDSLMSNGEAVTLKVKGATAYHHVDGLGV